jgi:hypothetical protein
LLPIRRFPGLLVDAGVVQQVLEDVLAEVLECMLDVVDSVEQFGSLCCIEPADPGGSGRCPRWRR